MAELALEPPDVGSFVAGDLHDRGALRQSGQVGQERFYGVEGGLVVETGAIGRPARGVVMM